MAEPAFPVPPDEGERLQALRELGLEEGDTELGLERVPVVAARACRRPWAGLSLIDESEHRFLASEGPLPRVFPREFSPCARAICQAEDLFVIEDVSEDVSFAHTPLVEEHGVRFYAGAPIRSPEGHRLGTVCVVDEKPGQLDEREREALTALGEVVTLHLELHDRTRQLERANEELDKFTTFVSHELTDPISQVVSNLDLLAYDLEELDAETAELLAEAREGAERMDRMTGDLLRYARASGRPLAKDTVDLDVLVEDAWKSLQPRRGRLDAQLETRGLPTVKADGDLLRRVVHNLVENAIEHAGGTGRIRIGAREEEQSWRVWVEDDGQGIPPEAQQDLFELFEQGPVSGGESSGVGLALCRRIVERHGGEIGVDSQPGQGSRFWFTLPRQE